VPKARWVDDKSDVFIIGHGRIDMDVVKVPETEYPKWRRVCTKLPRPPDLALTPPKQLGSRSCSRTEGGCGPASNAGHLPPTKGAVPRITRHLSRTRAGNAIPEALVLELADALQRSFQRVPATHPTVACSFAAAASPCSCIVQQTGRTRCLAKIRSNVSEAPVLHCPSCGRIPFGLVANR
jgi:hypothetical protein